MKKVHKLVLGLSLSVPLAHAEVRLIFCHNLQCGRGTPCGQMHQMSESKELRAMGVKTVDKSDYWGSDYQTYCKGTLSGLLATSLVIVNNGKRVKEYVGFEDFGFEKTEAGLLHKASKKVYKSESQEVRDLMIALLQSDFKAAGGKIEAAVVNEKEPTVHHK